MHNLETEWDEVFRDGICYTLFTEVFSDSSSYEERVRKMLKYA